MAASAKVAMSRMTVWDGLAEEGKTKTAAEAFFLDIFYGRTPARPGLSAKEGEDLPAGRAHRPGDCNQALMDLGATVCLPNAKPRCEACPWAGDCLAHAEKKETAYPLRAAKKERQAEDRTILLVLSASRALLHKRPAKGLLAGLYEFPNLPGHLSSEEVREWVRAAGFSPLRIRRLPEAKHIFTHKEWRMIGYEVRVDELQTAQVEEKGTLSARKEDGFFLTDRSDLRERYSLPSAFRTYTDHFDALSRKMEEKQR